MPTYLKLDRLPVPQRQSPIPQAGEVVDREVVDPLVQLKEGEAATVNNVSNITHAIFWMSVALFVFKLIKS